MKKGLEPLTEKLEKHIMRSKEDLIQLCSSLVRCPSENPPSKTESLVALVKKYLDDLGIRSRLLDFGAGIQALVAKIEWQQPEPNLILYAHGDVVPAGDRNRWKYDPYAGKVEDGHIFGRGACDMKGGMAAEMAALAALLRLTDDLSGSVTFVVVPDEESWIKTDKGYGTSAWLLDSRQLTGDACIMGEPTNAYRVVIGEKGDYWIRLLSKGVSAHGSMPILGDNAITKLTKAVSAIEELSALDRGTPAELSQVMATSREMVAKIVRDAGRPEKADQSSQLLDHISVNVGTIRGGQMINIVPEFCESELALCVPIGVSRESIRKFVQEAIARSGLRGVESEEMEDAISEPTYTSPQHRLVQSLERNIRRVLNSEPVTYIQPSTSDGNVFRSRGIPTCWCGPGRLELAHTAEENVQISDLVACAMIYAGTAVDFLGGK